MAMSCAVKGLSFSMMLENFTPARRSVFSSSQSSFSPGTTRQTAWVPDGRLPGLDSPAA